MNSDASEPKKTYSWVDTIQIEETLNPNNYHYDYMQLNKKLKKSGITVEPLCNLSIRIVDGPFGSQLKVEDYVEQGYPLFRVTNIIDGLLHLEDMVFINEEKQNTLQRSRVEPGDVLITKAGRIGSAAVNILGEANITSHLCLVRPGKRIDPYYLVAWLESAVGKLLSEQYSFKSTRPELTKSEVEKIKVAVPSKEIQKYIGDKVRKAGELREEARRLRLEAEEILAKELGFSLKLFKELPTYSYISSDVVTNYKWNAEYYDPKYITLENKIPLVKFEVFIEDITNGPHGGITYVGKEDGFPYLRGQNIDGCSISSTNMVYISELDHKTHVRAEVTPGDFVITITGVVGMAGVIPDWIPRANIIQSLAKVSINEQLIDKYYLAFYLNSDIGQMLAYRQASVTVQPGLNFDSIGKIQIYLPDDKTQVMISNKLQKSIINQYIADKLIKEARQDVEYLIEGRFDKSKLQGN